MKIRTQLVLAFSSLVIFSFIVAGVTAVVSARSVMLAILTAQHQRQAEMLGAVSDSSFALLVSFVWASMIAFAIWASEKLKERLRGRDYFPDDRDRRR